MAFNHLPTDKSYLIFLRILGIYRTFSLKASEREHDLREAASIIWINELNAQGPAFVIRAVRLKAFNEISYKRILKKKNLNIFLLLPASQNL